MSEVTWKNIDGYNGRYQISNTGGVRRSNGVFHKIMSTQIINSGYEIVHLSVNGHRKAYTIHRLVATYFLEKNPGCDFVDHIDCNKLNNNANNLRWVTGKENMQYASTNGLLVESGKKAAKRMVGVGSKYGFENSQKHLIKAVPITLTVNNQTIEFRSIRAAAKHLGIDKSTLRHRIKSGAIIPINYE